MKWICINLQGWSSWLNREISNWGSQVRNPLKLSRARGKGLAQCSLPLLSGLRATIVERGLPCGYLEDSDGRFPCHT